MRFFLHLLEIKIKHTMKITISGLSGSGKGTVGKQLLIRLPEMCFVSTGDMFRALARSRGVSINELHTLAESDPTIDTDIDAHTKKYGKENDNFIFDARLAWFWIPDAFHIFLTCEDTERFRRIASRENKSEEVVRQETLDREGKMMLQYRRLYGIENYLDTTSGAFHAVIDTTSLSASEVVDRIIEALNTASKNKDSVLQ